MSTQVEGKPRARRVGREQIPVSIVAGYDEFVQITADRMEEIIREKAAAGENAVFGLPTGSTPIGIYRELIRRHREEGLSFKNVITFNLDDYYPMSPDSIHSFQRFMWENFFDDIDLPRENANFLNGNLPREQMEAHCQEYEEKIRAAGGIDFQILGIGKTGHIGFNEPGSGRESRTRIIAIDTLTRRDAAADFFGVDNVPMEGVSMGVATIMDAREIVLLATGEHKAPIIKRAVEGPITPDVPASYLQEHDNTTIYVDEPAAGELTRFKTPWVVGEVAWTRPLEIQAVIWLSQVTGKSILRLETVDYRQNHLSALVARYGSAGPLNGEVFNALLSKIRGRSRLPSGKRIIVFSPHPDDDVISAGGILNKLHQNGNDILVAYQTSGNIAVFDHEVRRYVDFLRRSSHCFGMDGEDLERHLSDIEDFLDQKEPGEVDTPVVLELKKSIREAEAVSGIETFGMKREQARFLNLPFYQTGKVKKDPIGERDVEITLQIIEEHKPDYVLVAGDLSDPHGTHRMCLEAVELALERYEGEVPELWYYRGAWQEWSISEADILVPMSQDELQQKILAIFKHQSQKDRAPFPGPDDREFWQRVQERNTTTARIVDAVGLPEYFAMEAYVVRKGGKPIDYPEISTSELASPPRHHGDPAQVVNGGR